MLNVIVDLSKKRETLIEEIVLHMLMQRLQLVLVVEVRVVGFSHAGSVWKLDEWEFC